MTETTAEELRIIAKDAQRLMKQDRDTITRAADELDDMDKLVAAMQRALSEVQDERNAKVERITELTKPKPWTGIGFRLLPMTIPNWNYPR